MKYKLKTIHNEKNHSNGLTELLHKILQSHTNRLEFLKQMEHDVYPFEFKTTVC